MASDPERQALIDTILQPFCQAIPHNRVLGLRVVDAGPREASLVLPYAPELIGNPETGVLAGGAVTTLIDATCGGAVLARLGRLTRRIATLDLRIDYLRPARPGQDLVARAECYKLTRSVAFVRALAHQGDEADPVASAQGTFVVMETQAPL